MYAGGYTSTVDHAVVCKQRGFIDQRHNELRDLEAELLSSVCSDVRMEPILQDISGEQLSRGTNSAPDARLDIHARGFWGRQRAALFDVRVCHQLVNQCQLVPENGAPTGRSDTWEREEAPVF